MTGNIYANTTRKENGKRVATPREEWVQIDCPKIISPQVFGKVPANQKRNISFPKHYKKMEEAEISKWLDLLGEGKMDKQTLYTKNDEAKILIDKWRGEKETLQSNLDNFEGNQIRLQDVKNSFNDLKKFSSQIQQLIGKMDVAIKKEFLNSIFEARSVEVWDMKKMAEEGGIPYREKENAFELRGIEFLSLERVAQFLNEIVISNNEDNFTIQSI